MRTLWIIGDSFSSEFYAPNEGPESFKNRYSKYKGYTPKFFGNFLSEMLGIEYKILTFDAHDNSLMFNKFINNIDNILEDDIVSFGWTHTSRLRVVNSENNRWVILNAHPTMKDCPTKDFSIQSLLELSVNRSHPLYTEDLKIWMKAIDRLVPKSRVIHWTWSSDKLPNFEKINEETKGFIEDFHWSENGHKNFAEWFVGVYKNNIENKCYK